MTVPKVFWILLKTDETSFTMRDRSETDPTTTLLFDSTITKRFYYLTPPCRSTPVFKTVFTKRLFYSANDCFPYPAASTPAIFFKSVCYVQLWPWFGSVKAASTCPRGSCLYFMRNWFKNESSAVNGAWIRVKAEWKEVLSRERRF